ncbi:UNKNOWN [Stylonychia lemnae]|uniref:Transmembrane protein 230 n=1 Tax=Stylonychia lemnae TaxID=5949 RepID=A0A078AMJ8_STYLE|nr:UNKNOWN [Stylonychia lemnae]|eukprot:CDW82088.1 UNKNOWN [Stylonychia lemnae]
MEKKRPNNSTQDENSTEIDDQYDSDSQMKQSKDKPRSGPVTYDMLRQMSRRFHNYAPLNPFYREKIPYKTIIIAFLFFVGGLIFLGLGALKTMDEGFYKAYELFILGSILFIPGSYHTFIAFMACRRVEGYSFEEVAVFDENYNKDDD